MKFIFGLLLLTALIFAARGVSYLMDKIIKGRFSFWTGLMLSGVNMMFLVENPDVMDLPNDSVVAPAVVYSLPHYVLIGLSSLAVSIKDSDWGFIHELSDEIGNYMLMVSGVLLLASSIA